MAKADSATDAEDIVSQHVSPEPYRFNTYKQGTTWIVKYHVKSVVDIDEHEMRIDARDGRILRNT